MKKGLIMEGGAMRGMFTCGVIDVFMEHGIDFDGAVGVSAGAILGCNLKSRQIGRGVRYSKEYCKDYRYGSFKSLIQSGDLYDVQFCYHDLIDELDVMDREAYAKNPMEFYVTCTDVETGKAIFHNSKAVTEEDVEWFRASASMPLVSRIVNIRDYKLLDGGIADSIPVKFLESKGYDRNVVILTQPLDYVKKKNKLIPVARVALKDYPNMIHAMEIRHIKYNRTLKYIREKELAGELLVIRPKAPLEIGKMEKDPDELQRVYDLGREAALLAIPKIKDFYKEEM